MTTLTHKPDSLFGKAEPKRNEVMFWGVGGTGMNIVSMIGERTDPDRAASNRNVYLDTSRSNVNSSIDEDSLFIFTKDGKELDGSGGVRATNVEAIAAEIPLAVRQFASAKYNVLVTNLGGGSGSIITPILARALIEAGHHVYIVSIGSSESEQRTDNVIYSIESLESMAEITETPIPTTYIDYNRGDLRRVSDNLTISVVGRIAILLSGLFHGLDTRDLDNFFNYRNIPKMRDVKSSLVMVDILDNKEAVQSYKHNVISIASLYTDPNVPPHTLDARYDCNGYGAFPATLSDVNEMHFVMSVDAIGEIYRKLKDRADAFTSKVDKTVTRTSIVSERAKSNRHGLVL